MRTGVCAVTVCATCECLRSVLNKRRAALETAAIALGRFSGTASSEGYRRLDERAHDALAAYEATMAAMEGHLKESGHPPVAGQ